MKPSGTCKSGEAEDWDVAKLGGWGGWAYQELGFGGLAQSRARWVTPGK